MIKNLAGKIWWRIPQLLRARLIRSTQPKFTVSVAAIVTNDKKEVLVLDHFFRPRFSWGLPGGFLDPFEPPEIGIKRELREEADIELENIRLVRVRTIGRHIEILFRAISKGEARVNSREIRNFGWFPLDGLPLMSETQLLSLEEFLGK